jgi:hypothetical protein
VTEDNKRKPEAGEMPFLRSVTRVAIRIQKKSELLREKRNGLAQLQVN